MEAFMIVLGNEINSHGMELYDTLHRYMHDLHKDQSKIQLNYEANDSFVCIRGGGITPSFIKALSTAIAEHITTRMEFSIIQGLIRREFKLDSEEEILCVEGYVTQFLRGGEDTAMATLEAVKRRQAAIVYRLETYLHQNSHLVLEGFIRFRLQEYLEELRDVVEYAVDECIMDRQYQEFISLLQYFVYMLETKIPLAHLIHKGGHEFLILNDQLEVVDMQELDTTLKLEVLEKDVNFEDMIVSTLISVAPEMIYIHTREPELPIIKTITQIFEARTKVCPYCRMCHPFLGGIRKKDHLSP
jgi:putative sporulation protein YtxC